jgi:predicted double-glycine peptidase
MALPMPRFTVRAAVFLISLYAGVLAAEIGGVWLDVPFVKQDRDGCGAASIAMVMQYWQRQNDQPANPNIESGSIVQALDSRAAHGIRASDMVRYFEQNGYRAFAYAGDWQDLAHQLKKGRPLIAALRAGSGKSLHFVVVAGVDDEHQIVLMNDPAQRKLLKDDRVSFERKWKGSGYWTLLAVPETASH